MRTPLNQAVIFFVQLEPTSGGPLATFSSGGCSFSFCCCCACSCCCWSLTCASGSGDSLLSYSEALVIVMMPWRLMRTFTFTFWALPSLFGWISFTIHVPVNKRSFNVPLMNIQSDTNQSLYPDKERSLYTLP